MLKLFIITVWLSIGQKNHYLYQTNDIYYTHYMRIPWKMTKYNIVMEDIYIALLYTMEIACFKALLIFFPSSLVSFFIHMLILNLHSGAYSPNSCGLHMLRVLSPILQAQLMTGTQFNRLVGWNVWPEVQPLIILSWDHCST